ncbi:transcriptional regulator protein [Rhizobium rhizogenes K84]|uniref:HTH-type transcriptional regulator TtuA n=1 Tax=Rhizobium rhizogenes (strain K84 / ATCC BAA-868) TaxID=311403 RepID=B9J9U8_RHIR8|nr:transcriptional regulator protein [Rhizobium rhizogenes K84]
MSAPLDNDQLQTFIAIVDSGSFTKAADRVFKTQSAVSMQMRRLEERVGKQLFIKDGRGNRLTAEGEKLLNYARRIIRLNNEAIAAFDDNRLEGTLRIGTPDDYADRYMPEIIGRFAKTHPNVELYIVCEPSVDLAERMHRGELDIALVTHNPRERMSDVVRTEPLCWVGSANHPLRDDAPIPLAVGRRDCPWRQLACSALDAGGRDYQVLFTSWSCTVVASAVLAGMAVSVMPESALRTGMKVLTQADGFPPCRQSDRHHEAAGPFGVVDERHHRPYLRLPRQHHAGSDRRRSRWRGEDLSARLSAPARRTYSPGLVRIIGSS